MIIGEIKSIHGNVVHLKLCGDVTIQVTFKEGQINFKEGDQIVIQGA